jgi:rfaE bifunctional protein nucleotidyltransferase chain/domain
MQNKLQKIKNKINTVEKLLPLINDWKKQNLKIVFTNGCFDLIHRGHVEYLADAANCGDKLIIGLNTDASVKRLKGNNRPIQDEYARAITLAAMEFVDLVILFDEETPFNLISKVLPNILIKGSDYDNKQIVGSDVVEANGGKTLTIKFIDGYSTTSIINKIKAE